MVLVQHVEIVWTKATRGMPQAEARARLPRVYAAMPGNAAYGYARLHLDEADGFQVEQRESRAAARLPVTEGSLCLRAAPDGRLILGLRWNPLRGQPRRYPRWRPASGRSCRSTAATPAIPGSGTPRTATTSPAVPRSIPTFSSAAHRPPASA